MADVRSVQETALLLGKRLAGVIRAVVEAGTFIAVAGPRRFRLLIVEDNPAEAELIGERLSSVCSGQVDMIHALDMTRALRACEKTSFDCVVLDLLLPDTSGAETISTLRTRCSAAVIVAYSGMDNEALRIAALREGAQYFISKNSSDAQMLERCVLSAFYRWRVRNA